MKNTRVLLFLTLLISCKAFAYDFAAGDWNLRPLMGASVNNHRFDEATRETPVAGMLVGFEFDYMLDKPWSIGAALRPVFADGFIDLGLSAGVKYRITELNTPFVPYVGIHLTTAILVPTKIGSTHFNIGLRPMVGLDYYIMRAFAVGLEFGMEPSVMFAGGKTQFEFTVESLLGITFKV